MSKWESRPQEEANLLNPPFCALVLSLAVEDYVRSLRDGMPFALAFLVLPIVLHKPTRDSLPQRTTRALSSWLEEHEDFRATFAERARALSPYVREALLYNLVQERLKLSEQGHLLVGTKTKGFAKYVATATDEVKDCLSKARFVGRWLTSAGNVPTIFALWGVRP
jgi:Family of unknown function (DUF6521)